MTEVKDVGLLSIDRFGYLYRWVPEDRRMHSVTLPSGPGWVPEHYLTLINTYDIGSQLTNLPANLFTHADRLKMNNTPDNIILKDFVHNLLDSDTLEELADLDGDDKIPRIKKIEYEYVYIGLLQDQILPILKIDRCPLCGLPIEKHTSSESYMCDVCFYNSRNEYEFLNTRSDLPIEHNLLNDYNRGLSIELLQKKYPSVPLIDIKILTGS